jgi:DNA-binding NarL/FixJ family response regulator
MASPPDMELSPAPRLSTKAEPGSMPVRVRVIILDADPLFVEAVTPNLEALGIAVLPSPTRSDGNGLGVEQADVVLLDADGVDPHRAGAAIRHMPHAKCILMSARLDYANVRAAMQQGFQGALSKDIPLTRLASAILEVNKGDVVVEVKPSIADGSFDDAVEGLRLVIDLLTPREAEVLALLVDGASGAQMATQLSLSPHTVRTHVQNVMRKLQVHSRVEAVAYAAKHHWVPRRGEFISEELG